jgi:VRR-NUC domain
MNEAEIQNRIRGALNKLPNVCVWRNNVGAYKRDGVWIRYGLAVGSSDLIGIVDGRFLALEVKTPTGIVSDEQEAFIKSVRKYGGIAAVVRSVAEALDVVKKAMKR